MSLVQAIKRGNVERYERIETRQIGTNSFHIVHRAYLIDKSPILTHDYIRQ